MDYTGIKPFLCENLDKAVIRGEWEKWLRAMELYLASEEIVDPLKKRNKLLHFGGVELQEVAYSLPGAVVSPETKDIDVFKTIIDKLTEYFSPVQNSTFERHVFRSLKAEEGENLSKFLLKIRQQSTKCAFGANAQESTEINLKDKLIDCWAPTDLKKKLLEKERTLDEIIELCKIHEQTCQQSKLMNTGSVPGTSMINKISWSNKQNQNSPCSRCGRRGHSPNDNQCPAKKLKCFKCGFQGHFSQCCRSKGDKRQSDHLTNRPPKQRKLNTLINFLETNMEENSELEQSFNKMKNFDCFKIDDSYQQGELLDRDDLIESTVGGTQLTLLIDSGCTANILTSQDWKKLQNGKAAVWDIDDKRHDNLKPYGSCGSLQILHRFQTTLKVPKGREILAHFYVVKDGDISLLGKESAKQLGVLKLGLDANINQIEQKSAFPKIKDVIVKLSIDQKIQPVKQPVRRIPVAVECQVEEKLKEALESDIIEKVTGPSDWISPIVVLFKPDDNIRICVDMRRANQAILRENYPIPTFDSFLTKLRDAKYFSRLDLTNAYHQLELDEESRPITTFITHKGMFRYKRLMFGVNSAPEIFQRVLEGILSPCKNCINYLDDIIIFGSTEEEHDLCLAEVINTLREHNILLNESKCVTKVQELDFLGHRISSEGIDADQRKIETILDFRPPTTKDELRSFLGLVTYVGKFIPDLGSTTEPLRHLTKNDSKFLWTEVHQNHFDQLKLSLAKLPTLSYFNPKRRTRLVADASPVALGAVLLQFDEENNPHIIAFASKSLSSTERKYSQTEKESLALVWGVERFYLYLAGIEFELETDHKPLEAIFKPTSKPPARIERWLLRLQAFKFKTVFRPGKANIADSLSRLSQVKIEKSFDQGSDHHVFAVLEKSVPKALSISEIVKASKLDPEISLAVEKINRNSWEATDKNIYYPFRLELLTLGPMLLRGNKLVIPRSLRPQTLELAHEGHPGETVMKRRLRAKVWWPLIDREVECFVKKCRDCLMVSQPNKPPPMSRHRFPEGPWECLAMDLMGPLPNQEMVFVIIDYYSRYQEIRFLKQTTSSVIIQILTEIFSRLGYPKSIRSDNGRQFISQEFRKFCEENNIELIRTTPYWPQANGEVENMNKSILKRLQICYANGTNFQNELQKFTLMHNVTPHGTTGKSPSELMFSRRIRDKIPSIIDINSENINEEAKDNDILNKQKGKEKEDVARSAKWSDVQPGDMVLLKNRVVANKLVANFDNEEYEVLKKEGSELTLFKDNKIVTCHVSHVKKLCQTEKTPSTGSTCLPVKPGQEHPVDPQLDLSNTEKDKLQMPKMEPLKLIRKEGLWEPARDKSGGRT